MTDIPTVRLLIVEDNPVDVLWLKAELSGLKTAVFDIAHSSTLGEAVGRLKEEEFHLVLLDLGLPDGQGLDTFLHIEKQAPDTPIVVISGLDDESLALEAVRKGAQDYLVKDKWDGFLLSRSIAYAIERQRLIVQLRDTERSLCLSQESAKRSNRALRALTQCNHALIHATEESDFLQEVCRLIVETGGYRMAWIGMAMHDLNRSVKPVAVAGFVDGYLDAVSITWSNGETGRGPTGNAIRSGVPHINRNTLTDPDFFLWRPEALKRGYASSIALPLVGRDRIVGALTIYASDEDAFDEEELKLLTQLADDVGYEQRILEMRAEKEEADEALHGSEERFQAMFEGAEDAIYIKDRDLRLTHVNPSMARIFSRPASSLVGLRTDDLFPKEVALHVRGIDLRVLAGEIVEEERTLPVGGTSITFSILTVPLRDTTGAITGLCGVCRDITDWKRSVDQLSLAASAYPSRAMQAVLRQSEVAARKDSTLLLLGESGSGKDYLARYIHEHSLRATGPYFSINCSAVMPGLAESELFGHEKGAFTGAHGRKRGLLELAEGGTLLLNEIGELPLPLQAKLLTFLDTRKFTRVGGEREVSVNARLIAATNRDLDKEVEEGRFRKDLFYRINVFSLSIPPLRERLEDIPLLVQELLTGLQRELQITALPITDSRTMESLKGYHWPGNVRELRNVLERALIVSDGKHLRVHLPTSKPEQTEPGFEVRLDPHRSLHEVTDEVIHLLCTEALRVSRGNKKRAAQILRISRDSLYRYMAKFGMDMNGTDG
jgi:PAS domain S-box-containing protein